MQRTIQSFLSTFYIYSKNSLVTIKTKQGGKIREKKIRIKYIIITYRYFFKLNWNLKKKIKKKIDIPNILPTFDQNEKSKVNNKKNFRYINKPECQI